VASWDEDTEHLLEALYGAADGERYGNGDGAITISEVKAYLDRNITRAARRIYGRDQNATALGDDGVEVTQTDLVAA
jgi:hypothetical protein